MRMARQQKKNAWCSCARTLERRSAWTDQQDWPQADRTGPAAAGELCARSAAEELVSQLCARFTFQKASTLGCTGRMTPGWQKQRVLCEMDAMRPSRAASGRGRQHTKRQEAHCTPARVLGQMHGVGNRGPGSGPASGAVSGAAGQECEDAHGSAREPCRQAGTQSRVTRDGRRRACAGRERRRARRPSHS
jgi:hypothetical protein